MIFPYLLSFTFVSSGLASFHNHHTFTKRGPNNPDPVAAGSSGEGWQSFPDIPDATTFPEWVINADLGASIPAYQSSGLNTSAVKRAIIILPGKPRDCWYYWNVMNNALYTAAESDPGIKREEISIFAPCFFTQADKDAGAVAAKAMVFGDTTWASGQKNTGPDFVENFSSYQVLDALVSYYMDRKTYPNLNVVMLAGHSAGAQMAQRYIALRQSTTDDDRLHFWIANPGSLLWLTEDRPVAVADCEKTDLFKYGLAGGFPAYSTTDAEKLGRDGIVARYSDRNAHYAWGLEDTGPGDTRCEAMTQGSTHLERGQNFQVMLEGMNGGVPQHTTIDFIQGVAHDNLGMMASGPGIDKLFRYDYNGTTVTYTTTNTDNGTSTTASTSASQVVILSQLTIAFALLLGQFFLY